MSLQVFKAQRRWCRYISFWTIVLGLLATLKGFDQLELKNFSLSTKHHNFQSDFHSTNFQWLSNLIFQVGRDYRSTYWIFKVKLFLAEAQMPFTYFPISSLAISSFSAWHNNLQEFLFTSFVWSPNFLLLNGKFLSQAKKSMMKKFVAWHSVRRIFWETRFKI